MAKICTKNYNVNSISKRLMIFSDFPPSNIFKPENVGPTKISGQLRVDFQLVPTPSLDFQVALRACLQGGRVTLASGLTLAGGQKIARVYKQNFHR